MAYPKVSVIVLNWNGAALLEPCLQSVKGQNYPNLEIIVIDNASTDGSDKLIERWQVTRFIRSKENIGFSKAMNLGISASSGEFVIPLNYDIVLEPDFVSEILKPAVSNERVGSVTGKLLRLDAEGNKTSIIDSTGHTLFRNRLAVNRGEEQEDVGQYDSDAEVFGACGAAPLYRREMLDDIRVDSEYFDEDFFAFWEDIDLDWRARLRGWHCMYSHKAVAYHERGGPKKRRSRIVEYHNYKNRYLVMIKNDRWQSLVRAAPQMIVTEPLKAGALLLRSPRALASWMEVFRLREKMTQKRHYIQKNRTVPASEIEAWMERFDYVSWIKKNLLRID